MGLISRVSSRTYRPQRYDQNKMLGPRKDNTHRRTWDKGEYEERAKARIAAQPEPYRIWASQKSHRPKHLDQNMELKKKFGGPRENRKQSQVPTQLLAVVAHP